MEIKDHIVTENKSEKCLRVTLVETDRVIRGRRRRRENIILFHMSIP